MLLPVVICFSFIIIVGFVGNSIVLFVIASNRQLHDSTNILISSLAAADLLFLTFCVPLTAWSYLYTWPFSETACYSMITLQYLTCFASVWTLVLLAYERYLSITSPTKLKSIRRGKGVVFAIICVWFCSWLVNYPRMKGVGVIEHQYNGTVERWCVDSVEIAQMEASVMSVRAFFWGFNLLAYMLPLLFCTFFYALLLRVLKGRMVISKSSQKMKKRCTKMVFSLIFTFCMLWFSQNLRFFLRALSYPNAGWWEENESVLLFAQSAAQILAYSNSCVNPILYGVLSERFRKYALCSWHRIRGCSKRRSANDVYYNYKQTLFTRNPYDSKCDSRAKDDSSGQRTLNDNRNPSVIEASSFVTTDSPSVSNGAKPPTAQRPLVPRAATVVERDHPPSSAASPMPPSVTEDSIAVLP